MVRRTCQRAIHRISGWRSERTLLPVHYGPRLTLARFSTNTFPLTVPGSRLNTKRPAREQALYLFEGTSPLPIPAAYVPEEIWRAGYHYHRPRNHQDWRHLTTTTPDKTIANGHSKGYRSVRFARRIAHRCKVFFTLRPARKPCQTRPGGPHRNTTPPSWPTRRNWHSPGPTAPRRQVRKAPARPVRKADGSVPRRACHRSSVQRAARQRS